MTNQPTNQPSNQPTSLPTNLPPSQPTYLPIYQPPPTTTCRGHSHTSENSKRCPRNNFKASAPETRKSVQHSTSAEVGCILHSSLHVFLNPVYASEFLATCLCPLTSWNSSLIQLECLIEELSLKAERIGDWGWELPTDLSVPFYHLTISAGIVSRLENLRKVCSAIHLAHAAPARLSDAICSSNLSALSESKQ